MNFRLLQSSFVGVWEKPLNNLPPIERKILLDIFDDPYYTNIGFGPEGLIISHLSDNPKGNVILNGDRIQVSTLNHNNTSSIVSQIATGLKVSMGNNFYYPYSSIGINSEFEINGIQSSSQLWLNSLFFNNIQVQLQEDIIIQPYHVRFDLKLKNGLKLNILIQPSTTDEYGLSVSLNDDRFWSEKNHPSKEQLLDFYPESNLEFTNIFKKLLNLS